ncbi:radical SAM family heme chaperone HemW [Candidatus Omnitrophota bacterium]
MELPLYIHIPFCRSKCAYCDFYSIKYNRDLATQFIAVLSAQIRALKADGFAFPTIYIGGGTPSVLDAGLLKKLLTALGPQADQEVTLEANPESLTAAKLRLLARTGVNRLSIGVQSFDDHTLRFLGRAHNSRRAREAVKSAVSAGFEDVGIDLIYGIPSEDWNTFAKQLAIALSLPIRHISVYSLTYEKGTPLSYWLRKKVFSPLPQGEEARIYRNTIAFLDARGFKQYEVSNFAKKGFQARHNLYYWKNHSYLGLGPSAVSYRDGVRKKYTADLREYILKAEKGVGRGLLVESRRLSPLRRAKETAALNIRRSIGINFREFKRDTGFDLLAIKAETVDSLKRQRFIAFKKKGSALYGIRLTRKGFLFCDYVCRELL